MQTDLRCWFATMSLFYLLVLVSLLMIPEIIFVIKDPVFPGELQFIFKLLLYNYDPFSSYAKSTKACSRRLAFGIKSVSDANLSLCW